MFVWAISLTPVLSLKVHNIRICWEICPKERQGEECTAGCGFSFVFVLSAVPVVHNCDILVLIEDTGIIKSKDSMTVQGIEF